MKKILTTAAICTALLATTTPALAQSGKQCKPIGGAALGMFYDETKVLGALFGTWTATRGEITSKKETETGIDFTMTHAYSTADGGTVRTRDMAKFTAVPGKDKTFMVEISYTVVEAEGSMEGYSGTFYSFGLAKLGEAKAVVRYFGELCK